MRYVAAVAPELVASATLVGSPTQGSPVADVIRDVPRGTNTTALAASFVNGLTSAMGFLTGTPQLPQNALAAMESLTTAGFPAFHPKLPARCAHHGLRGLFTPDPVAFYRSHANRLKNLDL